MRALRDRDRRVPAHVPEGGAASLGVWVAVPQRRKGVAVAVAPISARSVFWAALGTCPVSNRASWLQPPARRAAATVRTRAKWAVRRRQSATTAPRGARQHPLLVLRRAQQCEASVGDLALGTGACARCSALAASAIVAPWRLNRAALGARRPLSQSWIAGTGARGQKVAARDAWGPARPTGRNAKRTAPATRFASMFALAPMRFASNAADRATKVAPRSATSPPQRASTSAVPRFARRPEARWDRYSLRADRGTRMASYGHSVTRSLRRDPLCGGSGFRVPRASLAQASRRSPMSSLCRTHRARVSWSRRIRKDPMALSFFRAAIPSQASHDGAEIVRELELGEQSDIRLVVVLATDKAQLASVSGALSGALPEAELVGCTTAGQFTDRGETGDSTVVCAIGGDIRAKIAVSKGLASAPEQILETLSELAVRVDGFPCRTGLLLLDPGRERGKRSRSWLPRPLGLRCFWWAGPLAPR